ncbi:acyl--CoA ligase [Actinocorallia sp. API 0066]|uniref:class I adenylate-forming enzyme family protein n=1 Tax=Actinocorallia sp. API 0066 TaxID=2896846 RepID=UPI001E44F1CE|nr:class I adenylate-forming enzyme family protein [Actinocorallia sp. API 0066]MCD0451615.1 acyl--CoA ligase [Actinocorallia sp. API 0066]
MSPRTDHDGAHAHPAADGARYPTIVETLVSRARTGPDLPYLTSVAADGATATMSFGQLDAWSARCRHWLRTALGVARDDVVGLLPVNDPASVVALFGLLRAGAVCLVLNPADPPARIHDQLAARGAKAVLCASPADAERLGHGAVAVPRFERAPDPVGDAADAAVRLDDDALFFGTSGSTAAAKTVAQTHRNAAANAEALRRHHRLRAGDRVLGFLPVHHVNGVHTTLFAPLRAGAHVVLAAAFDPFAYPGLIERFRPRIASAVPSVLDTLLATWREPRLPSGFDYFLTAAAPLSVRTAHDVHRRLGARIVQGYGLTETTNFATTMPIDLSPDAYRAVMVDTDVPPVGVPLFGNEVTVLDPAGRPVPPGEVGEVCMRGHNVMSRYAGNPEATDEAFRGGWFHSGDLGRRALDPHTGRELLVLTGRLKNIAKVHGEAVSLEEMEHALRRLDGVADAACLAVPDPVEGESVVAVVVTGTGREADIRRHLGACFPPHALPRRIILAPRIPRTPTGKLQRPRLLAEFGLTPPD